MKLRIRGNTIRIRVSQGEMAEIAAVGLAEDAIEFGPGARLAYRVQVVPEGPVGASYQVDCVSVSLPRALVEHWQGSDEVSIQAEQSLADGQVLKILVEKDFACLAPREEDDEGDLFPNPGRPQS